MISFYESGDSMIAALQIQDRSSPHFLQRLKAVFHPYDITVRRRKYHKAAVLHIHYHDYRGKINWQKLSPYLAGCHPSILCDKNICLDGTPYQRFESHDYTRHLIRNFVTDMLKKAALPPQALRIAYYDPMAAYPAMVPALADYSTHLTIVTDMPKFYEKEAEQLTALYGFSPLVSNSPEALTDSDIIVTTEVIDSAWPLSAQTIVFTPQTPLVALKGTILSEYCVNIPYPYQRLQPAGMDNIYFLSALYTLCGIKDMEQLLPYQCSDGQALYTADRLIGRLASLRPSA